jgi:DNA-binding NarL/FixJ family response regulator
MESTATLSVLTEQEKMVSELIAWGFAKKEIADKLKVSVRTIENHTRAIFKKIGVSKSNELSAWWFCQNYQVPSSDKPELNVKPSIQKV